MAGTLMISLVFSAFFLWVLKATYLHPEDAKQLGYTHKGKFLGCVFYCTLPDAGGEMNLEGANVISDNVVAPLMVMILEVSGKEFTMNLEVL